MKLEDQVCSLELAKKLKELGVKQESLFYWEVSTEKATHLTEHQEYLVINELEEYNVKNIGWKANPYPWQNDIWDNYSAYTVAELGEMLPFAFEFRGNTVGLEIRKSEEWWVEYNSIDIYDDNGGFHDMEPPQFDKKLVDAAAKMVIYLKENNLL